MITHQQEHTMMNDSRPIEQVPASIATANTTTAQVSNSSTTTSAPAPQATVPQALPATTPHLQLIPTEVLTQTEAARDAWRQIFTQRIPQQNRIQLITTSETARENLPGVIN
jgi:predicted transposase YdaD